MNYSNAFDLFMKLGKLILEFGDLLMRPHERPKEYSRLAGAGESHIQFICLRTCVCMCVGVYISLISALRLFCCSIVRDAKLSEARRIPRRSPQRNPL